MFFVPHINFPLRDLVPKALLCLIIAAFGQSLWWELPGLAATYRCHDRSGNTVLTDNPTQLFQCTRLDSQISSVPNSLPPDPQQTDSSSMEFPQPSQFETPPSNNTAAHDHSNEAQLDSEMTVPLKKIGDSFIVQATLNQERKTQLIVDTGASLTVLSIDTAIDLGILGTTDNELLTVSTAGGSVQVNINYLSSLRVGNAQATNVAVAIHDLPDLPDLHQDKSLHLPFFQSYHMNPKRLCVQFEE